MSHVSQFNLFKSIPFNMMTDPGNAGFWYADRQFGIMPLQSAGAETRTLKSPDRAGIYQLIYMRKYAGLLTLTVENSWNGSNTGINFSAAGHWVLLVSIETAVDTFRWRLVKAVGVGGSGIISDQLSGTGLTIGGNLTFTGALTLPLQRTASNTAVAAAGTDKTNCTAVGSQDIITISSDGAGKGVKLLAGVAGQVKLVINTTATACKLYPASGESIDGLAADAAVTIAASKRYLFVCAATGVWYSAEAAAATPV